MSITINGSGTITGSDRAASGANTDITSLSSLTVTPLNGGQLAGMRNRVINGNCNIAQRGSLVATSGVVSYGGPDRFTAANYAAGGQFTQSQSVMTFEGRTKNTVRQTVNTPPTNLTGTNYWTGIRQIVEGYNCSDLNNKPYAVSFIFNSNVSGVFTIALASPGSAVSFYITTFSATANTPTRVSAQIPANTITSVFTDNLAGIFVSIGTISQGTYQSSLLNSWTSTTINSASTATNWTSTVGNFIELTELQLEEGTVSTEFERRSYGFEMSLCQRYYTTFRNQIDGSTLAGSQQITNRVSFPVKMRGTPTVNITNVSRDTSTGLYATVVKLATSDGISFAAVTIGYGQQTWVIDDVTASAEL